jgi:hypothetical protein
MRNHVLNARSLTLWGTRQPHLLAKLGRHVYAVLFPRLSLHAIGTWLRRTHALRFTPHFISRFLSLHQLIACSVIVHGMPLPVTSQCVGVYLVSRFHGENVTRNRYHSYFI